MSPTDPAHPTVLGTLRSMSLPVQVLMWGTFISNLTAFLNAFLVLFLTTQRGMNAWYAGLALGGLLAGRVFGTAVGGAVADRIGYRWTTVASMVGSAAGVAAMVHVRQPWQAIVLSAVIGLVSVAYRPASQAWVMELTPERQHVMLFAVYRLAFNIGTVVGPLIAALLVKYSYALLFYADAAASLLFGLLALLLLPSDKPAERRAAAAGAGDGAKPAQRPGGYGQVLRDGRFVLFTVGLFLTAIAYIQGTAALPLFIKNEGHTEQVYAVLLALNGIMVVGLELVLTRYTQRLPLAVPIVVGMALLGVGHLIYLTPLDIGALVLGTFVWTLGEIVATPSMMAYPGRVAPPGLRARYVALSTMPQQAGYALGPLIGVGALELWGRGVWVVTGALGLVAALITMTGLTKVPDAPAESAEPPPETPEPPAEAPPVADPTEIGPRANI